MTPELAAALVARWAGLYTRTLPASIAERRVEELRADVHDHIAHERARDTSDTRIALSILSRMARGITADVAWRRQVDPRNGDSMKPLIAALVGGLVLAAVAFVADSPIILLVSVAVISAVILGLFVLGVRSAQQRNIVIPYVFMLGAALGLAALGVTSVVVGERADAPGLVLLGVVLVTAAVVGVFALGLRTAQRSS